MNSTPTEKSVRDKLTRGGALFASDEVRLLVETVDNLRHWLGRIVVNRQTVEAALDFALVREALDWPEGDSGDWNARLADARTALTRLEKRGAEQ